MKNPLETSGEYKLKMNLMVQNLLLTSIGMCKFVMMHPKHPISEAIKQFKLFDNAKMDSFFEEVKNAMPGQTLILNIDDELLIFTALDISCKAYITDLGDKMEMINEPNLKGGKTTFSEIRNTILKGSQFVMDGMRETLTGHPAFDDRVDILDNYILV